MRSLSRASLAALLVAGSATPVFAQDQSWQYQWYWGGQTGVYFFQTPTQDWDIALDVGGHWLITRQRVALHLAVDQILFLDGATSLVPNGQAALGFTPVQFDNAQRLQAGLFIIPTNNQLQLLVGGGFAIHKISDAVPLGAASVQEEQLAIQRISEFDTKAFVWLGAGVQWRVGKLAVFGNYQFSPGTDSFLITSEQHSITGGLRYALVGAREEVTTGR